MTNYTLDEYEPPYQWTFYHSIFFAFTVCSTLGETKNCSDCSTGPMSGAFTIHLILLKFDFDLFNLLGYGNIAPTITFSRYFMIVYALIGMPVNGILFTYLGEFFGSRVIFPVSFLQ